jgi:hypothetical protein
MTLCNYLTFEYLLKLERLGFSEGGPQLAVRALRR